MAVQYAPIDPVKAEGTFRDALAKQRLKVPEYHVKFKIPDPDYLQTVMLTLMMEKKARHELKVLNNKYGAQMKKLRNLDVKNLGDFRAVTRQDLHSLFGNRDGKFVHDLCDAIYAEHCWLYTDYENPKKIKHEYLRKDYRVEHIEDETAEIIPEETVLTPAVLATEQVLQTAIPSSNAPTENLLPVILTDNASSQNPAPKEKHATQVKKKSETGNEEKRSCFDTPLKVFRGLNPTLLKALEEKGIKTLGHVRKINKSEMLGLPVRDRTAIQTFEETLLPYGLLYQNDLMDEKKVRSQTLLGVALYQKRKKTDPEEVEPQSAAKPVAQKTASTKAGRSAAIPTDEDIANETRPIWKTLKQIMKDNGIGIMQMAKESNVHFTTLFAAQNGKDGKPVTLGASAAARVFSTYGKTLAQMPVDYQEKAKKYMFNQ